jgi:hypothetical protein
MPGTHQHGAAEGVALVHTIYGSPVASPQGFERNGGDIQLAGLHSTAPYKPPKRRQKDNPKKAFCPADGCRAFPTKTTGYCVGHSKQLGIMNGDWEKLKGEDAVDGDDS